MRVVLLIMMALMAVSCNNKPKEPKSKYSRGQLVCSTNSPQVKAEVLGTLVTNAGETIVVAKIVGVEGFPTEEVAANIGRDVFAQPEDMLDRVVTECLF